MASLKITQNINKQKDTAIYGLSSIIGRFLNYLFVPLYTAKISAASGGYGVITNMYAYTALLLVILTYGMETTFFRFVNKEEKTQKRFITCGIEHGGLHFPTFIALVFIFTPLSDAMATPTIRLMYGPCQPWLLMPSSASVRLPQIQEAPIEVCCLQVALHRSEHCAQPGLLRHHGWSRWVMLLHQPGLYHLHHLLLSTRN